RLRRLQAEQPDYREAAGDTTNGRMPVHGIDNRICQ
ncbi:hypothetical protein, partial [Pseudomonas aeruginosa]